MKFITSFFIIIIFVCSGYGQVPIKLFGIITDSLMQPIQYATISLHKTKESKALVATYSDEKGRFVINSAVKGNYWLYVDHNNYKSTWKAIDVTADSIPELKIQLNSSVNQLQNVTVKSTRRLIVMRDDGISYNVENDPMANSDKAIDLLRKIPMISVDGDNKITVNGQSSFLVLVNGRETAQFVRNPTDALKNYPGSIIKRIDVITNPSAKYDAEGVGGIINIITKKNIIGYNGSITVWNNYFNPFDWSSNVARGGSGSLNMKSGKFGLIVSAIIDGNTNFLTRVSEVISPLTNSFYKRRTSEGVLGSSSYSPEGNFEMSYEIDSLKALSLYGAFDRSRNNTNNRKWFLLETNNSVNNIQSDFYDKQDSRSVDWSIGADFIKKFKSSPTKEFTLKFYGIFGNDNLDNNSAQMNSDNSERYILNRNIANDKQYTIQTDYILPGKKNRALEMGAKVIFRSAQSEYQSYIKSNSAVSFVPNLANSDNFKYAQDVYSLYASGSFTIGKFNFRTGIRIEHTVVDGKFILSNTTVNQVYARLLPNLLISTRLKTGQQISFSYSQRLNRPYISALNPFVNNIDSLNVSTGNPNLGPQLSHVANIQYRVNGRNLFSSFSLGYSYSNSSIIYGYFFDKITGVTTSQPQNGGISERFFFNLSMNANLPKGITMSFNSNISYVRISSPTLAQQTNKGFSGQLGYNGAYAAAKKIAITSFANYYFPVLLLQGTVNGYGAYGFGGRYSIVKDKLTFNLSLNNIFNKDGEAKRVRSFSDQNFTSNVVTYNRFRGITFSVTWNFGKLQESVSKKRGVSNTDLL